MKKFFIIFSNVVVTILIVFTLLEIGLRIFPSLIPIKLLVDFQKELRAEIARLLNLQTVGISGA